MLLNSEQARVKDLLAETITLLCKNGLTFSSELRIEALIGITVDKCNVLLVNINKAVNAVGPSEAYGDDDCNGLPSADSILEASDSLDLNTTACRQDLSNASSTPAMSQTYAKSSIDRKKLGPIKLVKKIKAGKKSDSSARYDSMNTSLSDSDKNMKECVRPVQSRVKRARIDVAATGTSVPQRRQQFFDVDSSGTAACGEPFDFKSATSCNESSGTTTLTATVKQEPGLDEQAYDVTNAFCLPYPLNSNVHGEVEQFLPASDVGFGKEELNGEDLNFLRIAQHDSSQEASASDFSHGDGSDACSPDAAVQGEGSNMVMRRRNLRLKGKAYVTSTGHMRRARSVKPHVCTTCKLQCTERFSEEARADLCAKYWQLGMRQVDFVQKYVHEVPVKYMTLGHMSRRSRTYNYYLPLGGKAMKVCKRMFLSTLSLSDTAVPTILEKMKKFSTAI